MEISLKSRLSKKDLKNLKRRLQRMIAKREAKLNEMKKNPVENGRHIVFWQEMLNDNRKWLIWLT